MKSIRAIAAVLSACTLSAACGAEGFAVGGRLVPEGGSPLASGTYRLEAAFATNATAAAFATASATVTTDAAGNYVAALPVSVDAIAAAGTSVWVRQAFRTTNAVATAVATLPAQRLGSAPYALQASVATRLATTNGAHALQALDVTNALLAATLAVTNRTVVRGILMAENLTAADGATVRIDRLAVGALGSTIGDRTAATTVTGPYGGTLRIADLAVASDGLFELALVTQGAAGLTATLRRTSREGLSETLRALDAPDAAGTTRRVLTVPVRSGDTLALTAACGSAGQVTAVFDFLYFGTTVGDSDPGGESE